jgi:2-C-methyl-D-erythritol 4-phosphate cytidylyltransferase
MKKYAIIVAGGKGVRMGNTTPKQFLLLAGKPVLMHTINAFYNASKDIILIVVLPENDIKLWNLLIQQYSFKVEHKIIQGGETRFHSVQNGLNHITKDSIVAIHDGVRPLVSKKAIDHSFTEASFYGNAITSVKLKESIRFVDSESNKTVDRTNYRLIQTPQTFKSDEILEAFKNTQVSNFTDDAGVLEAYGKSIHLIDGEYHNIKITTPEDLVFAASYINKLPQ